MARVFSLLLLIPIVLYCCESTDGVLGSWVPQDWSCWSAMGSECRARFMAASILEDPSHVNHHCCDTIVQQKEKKVCNWKNHPKKPNLLLMSTIIKDYCQTPESHNTTTTKTGDLWKLGCVRRLSSPLCMKKVMGMLSANGGRNGDLDLECCPEMDQPVVGGICLGLLSKFEKGRYVVSACKKKVVPAHGKPVLP